MESTDPYHAGKVRVLLAGEGNQALMGIGRTPPWCGPIAIPWKLEREPGGGVECPGSLGNM